MDPGRRARWVDRIASAAIASGGIAIILSVVAILFFVAREAAPLFLPARGDGRLVGAPLWEAAGLPLAVAPDEYRALAIAVLPRGPAEVRSLEDGRLAGTLETGIPAGVRVVAADRPVDDSRLVLAGDDGRVRLLDLRFAPDPEGRAGRSVPVLAPRSEIPLAEPGTPLSALAYRRDEALSALAAAVPGGSVLVEVEDADEETSRQDRLDAAGGGVTSLAITGDARTLVAGTDRGRLLRWTLSASEAPRLEEDVAADGTGDGVGGDTAGGAGGGVTSLCVLTGGRSIAVASGEGSLAVWSLVREESHASGWRLRPLHRLPAAPAPVVSMSAAERFRGFVAGDAAGNLSLYHATSARRLLTLRGGEGAPALVSMAPRADGAVGVDARGGLWAWSLRAPHPEVSLGTLFGRVWYEGYERPEHVWQSSGSTDDFEPKLSLTPLVFGTLKGTLYALAFAVPVAILAAVYTALFAPARARSVVKPAVELMAGLPSVVVGFLAGLWMAPLVERHLPGVLLSLALVPALVMAAASLWGALPQAARKRLPAGGELALLLPLILAGAWLALALGPLLEGWAFAGDLRGWIYQALGLAYDQRNALVVGFAMGFAVIPIIFTISEDSIAGVPPHLVSGALALGASRWQAALRVILPTASPGIFSAVMIGFGRAVGETMIVLMATGNTPVMDWSPFNGLRTLSANIAVEMPEAPYAGTLYRVLFLAAGFLFVMTFAVNTAAELVRMRLRARYARL